MNEILKKRIEEAAAESRRSSAETLTTFGLQSSIDAVVELTGMELSYDEVAESAFEKGAEYAISHQWIRVEEALPELMERVLVAYRLMDRISICIMKRIPHDTADPDNGKWHWSLVNHKEDVIAWMPIPKFETNVYR